MSRSLLFCLSLTALPLASVTHAQTDQVIDGPNATRVVVSANEGARSFQEHWGYAPAIRAGDLIVMSGLIAAPAPGEGRDAEAFKRGLRRVFAALGQQLAALDASFEDVIRINSYHVFDSEHFDGDKLAHLEAVREVKEEVLGEVTPTWTAIGVSELFTDSGLVEIELTAYAPSSD